MWIQREMVLKGRRRGYHLIDGEVQRVIGKDIGRISVGLLNIFCKHTSASLSVNENYDPSVREDMEDIINQIVPASKLYRHSMEGDDDMPAHMKSSLMGASLTIPITNGRLNLGTWQGIYFCEHRDHGGSRRLILTINGSEENG